jgi:hypothetical protein
VDQSSELRRSSVGAEGLEPPTFACKGEKNVLVRALTCGNAVSLGTAAYLGVSVRCYAKCYARSGLGRHPKQATAARSTTTTW